MKSIPQIKALMTPFPYSVNAGESIDTARQMMADHGIRHLPVMNEGRLFSVVADRDLQLALDPALRVPEDVDLRVRDVCARQAYIVELTQPVDVVLLHMARHHLDCAVVTKDRRLVGIFTVTDACASFGEFLRTLFPRNSPGDAA